ADAHTLCHLLKYDSVHGSFPGEVRSENGFIYVNDTPTKVINQSSPADLPWADLGIDVVIESTGRFTNMQDAHQHLQAGAKQVIISAPSTDNVNPPPVCGNNDSDIDLLPLVFSND